MQQYTIYCTSEQTEKALELGAPIEIEFEDQFLADEEEGYDRGGTFQGLVDCMGENTTIFGNEPNRIACIVPTTEQMLGWLEEEFGLHIQIDQTFDRTYFAWLFCMGYIVRNCKGEHVHVECPSKREATLAAIDAALKYLEQKEKGGINYDTNCR